MKKMFLLFSHQLNQMQIEDAKKQFGIELFVPLKKELQTLWSSVSPELESIVPTLLPIKEFLIKNSKPYDIVLVQGDFGVVYNMVNFSKEHKLIPVYATTKRNTVEYKKENKTFKESIFEFRRFREYE